MNNLSTIKDIREVDKIENFYKVVKSNVLVDSIQTFSANELKIILSIISLINPTDKEENMRYRITASSLQEILGDKDTAFYSKLKKMTFNILSQPIWYEDKENNETIQGNWFSSFTYKNGEGVIEVAINPEIKHLLVDLKANYTSYMLENVINLKSKYAIRIYQLLKKAEGIKSVTFYIDELRKMLNVENKYKQYNQFKMKILEPSKRELLKHTDIKFNYKELKTSRKVDRIKFNITENVKNIKPSTEKDMYDKDDLSYELDRILKTVKENNLQGRYGEDYLRDKIEQFNFEKTYNQVKITEIGETAYFNSMVKNNYQNPKFETYKKELKEKKIKKEKKEEKQRIDNLQNEYEEYIESIAKSYNDLEKEEQKRIDDKVYPMIEKLNIQVMTPDMLELTLDQNRKHFIIEKLKKEIPFIEWELQR